VVPKPRSGRQIPSRRSTDRICSSAYQYRCGPGGRRQPLTQGVTCRPRPAGTSGRHSDERRRPRGPLPHLTIQPCHDLVAYHLVTPPFASSRAAGTASGPRSAASAPCRLALQLPRDLSVAQAGHSSRESRGEPARTLYHPAPDRLPPQLHHSLIDGQQAAETNPASALLPQCDVLTSATIPELPFQGDAVRIRHTSALRAGSVGHMTGLLRD